MSKIYFDHSATTPVDQEVLQAMQPFWSQDYGNPSSLHSFGQDSLHAVDSARDTIAKFLGTSKSSEIVFTSGATEANNLVVQGVVKAYWQKQAGNPKAFKPHVITTAFEHPCVLETIKELEKSCIEATFIKPDKDGLIKIKDIQNAMQDNTILVSIMYANNEIGTIQPIQEIGEMISEQSKILNLKSKILFHTDAVQAVNYCPTKVDNLKVDLLSLSGHKIYGPKGVGALYVRSHTPIQNIQYGGHHEFGLRPGTVNTPLIVGLAKAVELISQHHSTNQRIKSLRDKLWQGIRDQIQGVRLNGSLEDRIPSNLNVNFEKVEGESLLLSLDMEGVAVSTGSACSSGSLEPSHVLISLGYQREQTHGSLRITLGRQNTTAEVNRLLQVLPKIINRLRGIAPSD